MLIRYAAHMAQYLGRWIHHSGWYPDRKVRLYNNRQKAHWQGEYGRMNPCKWTGGSGHFSNRTCCTLRAPRSRNI